jgi:hypothetical protein
MIRHSFRRSLGAPFLTCTLMRQGIVVERRPGVRELIPYAQVRAINLQSHGLQCSVPRYTCTIRAENHRTLRLCNNDFVGLARVEARDDTYRRFVTALHRLVEPHRASIDFTHGSRFMFWLGWDLMACASVLLVVARYILGTKGVVSGWGLGPAFTYGAFCATEYRRDAYSPEKVPANMLPRRRVAATAARTAMG